jgi:hypothetical protein
MRYLAPIFKAKIENGKLVIENKKLFEVYLYGLNDKEVEVIIRKPKKHRSLKQNAYYWGVVIPLVAREMGEIELEETHDFMRNKFLRKGIDIKGKRYEITRGTSSLSTVEFEDYLEKCRVWANLALQLNIPLPNEVEI